MFWIAEGLRTLGIQVFLHISKPRTATKLITSKGCFLTVSIIPVHHQRHFPRKVKLMSLCHPKDFMTRMIQLVCFTECWKNLMRFGSNIQATQQQPGTVLQKPRQNISGPQVRHLSSLHMYIPWGKAAGGPSIGSIWDRSGFQGFVSKGEIIGV